LQGRRVAERDVEAKGHPANPERGVEGGRIAFVQRHNFDNLIRVALRTRARRACEYQSSRDQNQYDLPFHSFLLLLSFGAEPLDSPPPRL
jgi:hypothetical protein